MKKERLFYLDLIRAISVILIIIYHYNLHLGFHGINGNMVLPIIPNSNYSSIGISLFILISGAALMYTYQNKIKIKEYTLRRFWSIYPVFWTGYLIAFLYAFLVYKSVNESAPNWTIILTILGLDGYLSNLIPNFYLVGEWFLGFIIIYYVLFPLLRKYVIAKPITLILITVLIFICSIYANAQGLNIIGYPDIFSNLPIFLFGMYFIFYLKKVNVLQFICALLVALFTMYNSFNINVIVSTTFLGISVFMVLVYLSQILKNHKIIAVVTFISKYSFASIVVNQLVMAHIMKTFSGITISTSESYLLFIIVYIFITIVAIGLHKLSGSLVKFIRQPNI